MKDVVIGPKDRLGRCWTCHKVVVWLGGTRVYKVREAYCPTCGHKLARTTYSAKDPFVRLEPIGVQSAMNLQQRLERGGAT